MKSIQTKLTMIILILFTITMGTLGGLNYWKAHSVVTEDIKKSMQLSATDSAGGIGEWLATLAQELQGAVSKFRV